MTLALRILAGSLVTVALACATDGLPPDSSTNAAPSIGAMSPKTPEPAAQSYRLEDLLALADRQNRDIRMRRAEVDVARGNARQAGLYPNPSVTVMEDDLGLDSGGDGNTSVLLTQPVIVGGRRGEAVRLAMREIDTREAQLQATRHAVLGDVHMAALEMIGLRDAIALQRELVETAQATETLAREHAESGGVPESDVLKAAYDLQQAEQGIVLLFSQLSLARARLRGLVGGTDVAASALGWELEDAADFARIAVTRDASVSAHPALNLSEKRLATATAEWTLRRAERVPDVDVMLGLGYDRAKSDPFATGGLRVPIPVFDRAQGRIDAAASGIALAEADVNGTREDLAAQLDGMLLIINEADTLVALFRESALPAAEASFAAARSDFVAGKATLFHLLDAQRTLLVARKTALRYRLDLNVALARLAHFNRYEGTPTGHLLGGR